LIGNELSAIDAPISDKPAAPSPSKRSFQLKSGI
jgi:hypothetical protein